MFQVVKQTHFYPDTLFPPITNNAHSIYLSIYLSTHTHTHTHCQCRDYILTRLITIFFL